jgi:hypothetical protein
VPFVQRESVKIYEILTNEKKYKKTECGRDFEMDILLPDEHVEIRVAEQPPD